MPVNLPSSSGYYVSSSSSYSSAGSSKKSHKQNAPAEHQYDDNNNAGSSVQRHPAPSAEEKLYMARQVYERNVVYHITEKKNVKSIRKNGFDLSKKTAGATAKLAAGLPLDEGFTGDAYAHNYVMSQKQPALELNYFDNPALVRAFRGNTKFELDPEFFGDETALRTKENIPASQVLSSSRHSATEGESRLMKQGLRQDGLKVSTKEAGQLLKEVQSDSEDDFA